MRFIWNFIFFGILFYLIWWLFPDAFMTLVSWANHVVNFLRDLIIGLWGKAQPYMPDHHAAPEKAAPAMLLLPLINLIKK